MTTHRFGWTMVLALVILQPMAAASAPNPESRSQQNVQLEANADTAERKRLEAELKASILDARQQVQDSAYARLEILMGLFGLLITILVIAFGFRTEKAAARAARGELADRQAELDEILATARRAAEAAEAASSAAQSASAKASAHAVEAAEESARAAAEAAAIAVAKREAVQSSIAHAAGGLEGIASSKDETTHEGDVRDFQSDFEIAYDSANWQKVVDLARDLLASDLEPVAAVYTMARQAHALGKLGLRQESLQAYTELIAKFSDSQDLNVRTEVASATYIRGLIYADLGNPDAQVADFTTVITKYSDSDDAEQRRIVSRCMLWRGLSYSSRGDAPKAIADLEQWASYIGRTDCAELRDKSSFLTPLRNDLAFQEFLARGSCGDIFSAEPIEKAV